MGQDPPSTRAAAHGAQNQAVLEPREHGKQEIQRITAQQPAAELAGPWMLVPGLPLTARRSQGPAPRVTTRAWSCCCTCPDPGNRTWLA
jgi:hypothetical protein